MKDRVFTRLVLILTICAGLFLQACAGSGSGSGENSSTGDSGMGDAPCTECGARGEIKLKVSAEKFYREWNEVAYGRLDSTAVVGVLPTLKVTAGRPEACRMCHSYSADALDFDLAHVEDSLFVAAFPKMRRELLLPGMRLPESDSLYIDSLSIALLQSEFADGKKLEDFTPWQERDGVEQKLTRQLPDKFRNLLNELASRYELRYVSMPVRLDVYMDPDLGSSGGYTWKILWSLWDVRYGELVFLIYSEFTAETTSRVAPEKEWATPFAARLWKMFSTDPKKIENR
jgi:hypothetical protein